MNSEFEKLGDRLKALERVETTRRADKSKPLMCRLDGRAFHTFTRGLKRPYDIELSTLMADTMKYLVQETHASLGYTQSDEITLYWHLDLETDPKSQFIFDGKFQKLTSVLAGMASGFFNSKLHSRIPIKADSIVVFDARVWSVDDSNVAYLNFLWRQEDAIKNSISMAADANFSEKMLNKKNSIQRKKMLLDIGIDWNDYPDFFKYGTFAKRVKTSVTLSPEELDRIPPIRRPVGQVERSSVVILDIGDIHGNAEFRKGFV